ncbi:hypothetical protein [Grimontia marina]|uniref:Serralysin n=1 Tax=Grimontia marina TaxID=646534 RepID=A0A128F3N1_9GAMM|nr:hypothetical protein [Grimontia marina]CZF81379.1 hypothetical protein GMA8713_01815 [Grimontia marina]
MAGWNSFGNLLDGQSGEDILKGGTNSDTLIFDNDDFQGQTFTLPSGRVINKQIYDASTGFDVLKISDTSHADFTGAAYQTMPGVTGNIVAGIEAAIGGNGHQTVTINIHAIDAQSDTVERRLARIYCLARERRRHLEPNWSSMAARRHRHIKC